MSQDSGLRHKVALVTGSATGIGEAIARQLAEEGARVMVHGRAGQAGIALEVADAIHRAGGEAEVQLAELQEEEACETLIDAVVERFGRLDILVNNAATIPRADLQQTDAKLFDEVMQVNLRAPLLLTRAALPHFRRQGGGRVLNIGSLNSYCGEANLLAYAISKGGLMTLTRNLADAHGAECIRVNQMNVGWVLTRAEYERKVREGLSADWPKQIPASFAPGGRIFEPREIAGMAVAFLSDAAALVNGSIIDLEQYPLLGRNPHKSVGF
jgi:NAD(P)-dependent dehydrogenase (short-subunit alcohol dehydrogenase family)